MKLEEIGKLYRAEAAACKRRLAALRRWRRESGDAEKRAAIGRMISFEADILEQCNALAECCEKYYDRSYYRNPKYTLQGVKIHGEGL